MSLETRPLRSVRADVRKLIPIAAGSLVAVVAMIIEQDAVYYTFGAIFFLSICVGFSVYKIFTLCFSKLSHPIFIISLVYILLFYVLPGLIHLNIGRYPFFNQYYSGDVETKGALVVLIFVLGMSLGYGNIRRHTIQTRHSPSPGYHYVSAILFLAMISLISGLSVGYGSLMATRGEISDVVREPSVVQLVLRTLARISPFFAFTVSLIYVKINKSLLSFLILCITFFLFIIANNPLSIPRYILGSYLITIFLLFTDFSVKQKFRFLLVVACAQFTIFPLLSDASRGDGVSSFRFAPLTYLATHGDFDGFQSTLNVVAMTEGDGFALGRQLLSAVFFFVPRSFFPSKSVGTGGDAATYVGYPFINISAPLPSELYVDFGMLGLAILSILFGYWVRKIDIYYEEQSRLSRTFSKMLPSVIGGYAFILMRGSLVGVLGPLVLSSLLIFLVAVIFKRRKVT